MEAGVMHDTEAERAVVASILLRAELFDAVYPALKPEHFYTDQSRMIYSAQIKLSAKGTPIDLVSLKSELESMDGFEKFNIGNFIDELLQNFPIPANIEHYAKRVIDLAICRKLVSSCQNIYHSVLEGEFETVQEILDNAERKIFECVDGSETTDGQAESAFNLFSQVYKQFAKGETLKGSVEYGFIDLDRSLGGMMPGSLIIVAGRPSMGKSSFAVCVSNNAALNQKKHVLFVSLEVSGQAVALNAVCAHARISSHAFRTGRISEEDLARLLMAAGPYGEDNGLLIHSAPNASVFSIRSLARRIKRKTGLDLLVVDYLQLVSGGRGGVERHLEVGAISRALKALALELDIPVIALSQINRMADQRDDRRPRLSDLRESGSIEQDADVVFLLYRDEYYTGENSKDAGTCEAIIAKNRNGKVGTIKLSFAKDFMLFQDLARAGQNEYSSVPEYEERAI